MTTLVTPFALRTRSAAACTCALNRGSPTFIESEWKTIAALFSAETLNCFERIVEAFLESEPGTSIPPALRTPFAFPASGAQTTSATTQIPSTHRRRR